MTTIKLKNGSGAPLAGDLVQGEPALDLTNKRLYTEDSGGSVIEVGTNPTSLTTGTITSGDITVTDATPFIRIQDSDVTNGYMQISNINGNAYMGARNDSADGILLIGGYGGGTFTEFARWSETGNFTQIGQTTFTGDVTISEATPAIVLDDSDNANAELRIIHSSGSNYYRARGVSGHGAHIFQRNNDGATHLKVFQTNESGDVIFYGDDGSTEGMRWKASTDRLGILDGTPASALQVGNSSTVDSDAYVTFGKRVASTESNLPFIGHDDTDGGGHNDLGLGTRSNNGTINFYTGNSTTAFNSSNIRMTIDSAGNVGIGTTDPSRLLTLSDSGDAIFSLVSTTANTCQVLFGDSVSDSIGRVSYDNSDNSMALFTSQAERMRIDSSGLLGIGESNPARHLHVNSGSTEVTSIFESTGASSYLDFANSTTAQGRSRIGAEGTDTLVFKTEGAERLRILAGGGLTFNGDTATANALDDYEEGTYTVGLFDAASGGNQSSSTTTGYYTKIGRVVTVNFYALNDIDTTGMTAGNVLYFSLPFNTGSTGRHVGQVSHHGFTYAGNTQYTAIMPSLNINASRGSFSANGYNDADATVKVSDISSGADDIFTLSITYHV